MDLLTASMSASLGAAGGFCCGDVRTVDHQRLSGEEAWGRKKGGRQRGWGDVRTVDHQTLSGEDGRGRRKGGFAGRVGEGGKIGRAHV